MIKNRTALIFGGNGFLGSHVVDELVLKKYKVTIFDKVDRSWRNKKAKFIKGNISNQRLLENHIKKNKIIYNFAGVSDLDKAIQKPVDTIKFNILANARMLDLCAKYDIQRYIFSSSIYANSSEGGFYRCSKLSAEQYIIEFNKIRKVPFTILRYGSLYGLRSGFNNRVKKIIYNAKKNKKFVYFGSKNSIRKYIHVEDAAKASVGILKKKYRNKIIVLTGKKSYYIKNIFMFLSKHLMIDKKQIKYKKMNDNGHYIKKPKIYKIDHGKVYNFPRPKNFYLELKKMIGIIN